MRALPILGPGDRRGGGKAPGPGRFTPQNRPATHCTEVWVGLRAGLDGSEKSRLRRGSNSKLPRPQRVAMPTTLSRPPGNIW